MINNVKKSISELWKKEGAEVKKTAKEVEGKAVGIAKDISAGAKQAHSDMSKAGTEAKKTAKEGEGKAVGIAKDISAGAKQVYSDVSKKIKDNKTKR